MVFQIVYQYFYCVNSFGVNHFYVNESRIIYIARIEGLRIFDYFMIELLVGYSQTEYLLGKHF